MAIKSAVDILLRENKEISAINVAYVVNNVIKYHHGVTAQEAGQYMRKNPKLMKCGKSWEQSSMGIDRSRQKFKRRPKK